MKKIFLLIPTLVTVSFCTICQAQVKQLVDTEKAFAQLAKEKGTKQAFLANLSESSVLFRPGPVNGKQFWEQQPDEGPLLTWEPVFADVAASGDWGFTTGPFGMYRDKTEEKPGINGDYVSVWAKENGQWKLKLDIGVNHPPLQKEEAIFFDTKAIPATTAGNAKKEVEEAETNFIQQQNANGWAAYPGSIAASARIYRPQSVPYVTDEQRKKLFIQTDKKFTFENTAGDIAASGDMAYMYGKAKIDITADGNTRTVNGNYLRIWKKEGGGSWKILVDLVNIAR